MPCSCDGYPETLPTKQDLEQMLCFVMERCSVIQQVQLVGKHPGLDLWWQEHQEKDRERLEREDADQAIRAAKASAMAKLTPQERALLGFNEET